MSQYDGYIQQASLNYGVPIEIIQAIIQVESSGNPNAYLAEPRIKDASYGLMQILYATARGLGYSGLPQGLFDSATNIDLGTHYLSNQYNRYGNWPDAFAAYNAGSAVKNTLGIYVNQSYVDKVLAMLPAIPQPSILQPVVTTVDPSTGETINISPIPQSSFSNLITQIQQNPTYLAIAVILGLALILI